MEAKDNRSTYATEIIHEALKAECHRRGFATTPFGWEVEGIAEPIYGHPRAVYFKHRQFDAFGLSIDDAQYIADGLRQAAATGGNIVVETTIDDRRIVMTDKGKGVKVMVDDVTITMPRMVAVDLAEAIEHQIEKAGA